MYIPTFVSCLQNNPQMVVNLIDRVKHSFSKDKKLSSALYDILGFYPHNLEFYRAALAHKSQSYRNRAGKPVNNERLEYLGDAILEAVVSDIVFHRYPRKREGFLTSTRSKIVQRSSLNKLSADLGLDRLIKTTALPGPRSNNIGGNAFEALMGAVYLDRGYHHCQWFIEKRIIGRLLDIDGVANKEVNFKSKLLEWTQKNRILAEYTLEEKVNEENGTQEFHSAVVLEGIVAGKGVGHSKKESQQIAAKEALTKLRREPKFLDSIYRAKEKRTAMEADEVCVVPRIEEIEAEISQTPNPHMSRNAKLAPGRAPKPKRNAQKPAAANGNADEKTEANGKRAQKPAAATPAAKPADAKRKDVRRDVANAPQNKNADGRMPKANDGEKNAAESAPALADATLKKNMPAVEKPQEPTTEAAPADTPQATAVDNATRQEREPRRRPARRQRRSTALPAIDGTPRNVAEAEREAIVQQAEEAAYNEL